MIEMLCRAFEKDPFYQAVFKEKKHRLAWFSFLMKYALAKGKVIREGQGAALLAYGNPKVRHMLYFGILKVFWLLGIKKTILLLRILFCWEKAHKKVNPKHLYLMILFVDPDFQGKGTGSQLLGKVKELCKKEGLFCFLETVTQKNADFYNANGFTLLESSSFLPYFENWFFLYTPKED